MIKSMTGFGDASGEAGGVTFAVEIKTLNNRYLKSGVKLGDAVAFLEEDIDRLMRESFIRGTISCAVKLTNGGGTHTYEINRAALARYISEMKAFAEDQSIGPSFDVGSLMSLPGVLSTGIPQEKQELLGPAVLDCVRKAIEKVNIMRVKEGVALTDDIMGNCSAIETALEKIALRVPDVVKEYHDKLSRRIDDLLASAKLTIDSETLAREVAIYADRCDISEEISRLRSHIKQFRATCERGDQAGRKLDFISQEMLREANTIGSKSADPGIAGEVVDIKCYIDRLKEQVQNVE